MDEQGLDQLVVSPAVWKKKGLIIQPEDLSSFSPHGNGVYGYQESSLDPIKGAPLMESSGGQIYFGNDIRKEDFEGFLRMMRVRGEKKDYAAFISESAYPLNECYLTQMRLVSKFGLRFMFNALGEDEYDQFENQALSITQALCGFMEAEKRKFGTSFGDRRIAGKAGGDGHYAQEELGFGFMVENMYYDVYRIWSRAWLVTK